MAEPRASGDAVDEAPDEDRNDGGGVEPGRLAPIAAAILVLLGALGVFFGFVVAGIAASGLVAGVEGPTALFIGIGGAILGLGALQVATGIGLLARAHWAPLFAVLLSGLGIGLALLAVVQTLTRSGGPNPMDLAGPGVLLILYGLVFWTVIERRRVAS